MKIRKIEYPTPLSEIKDIENDNVDIIIQTDDGMIYTLVVSTPKNYYWYMDKEGLDFMPAGQPSIIVRSLTEENIRNAVQSYLDDDGYWLKLYYLIGNRNGAFDIKAMNSMIEKIKEENKEIFG